MTSQKLASVRVVVGSPDPSTELTAGLPCVQEIVPSLLRPSAGPVERSGDHSTTRIQKVASIAVVGLLCCLYSAADAQLTQAERVRLRRSPIVKAFESCKGSVVNISTTQIIQVRDPFSDFDSIFNDLFDYPQLRPRSRQFKTTAVGSGFVIHRSGYIVTNAHVVARTAERKVIFENKEEYDAHIVALAMEYDLAVLKIDADKPLKPLAFGRSDDLMIGETVIAVGNPMGLQNTLTTGVISALDRSLEVNNETVYEGLIQTDASINPGNSGGPLLNILGELIGVNTAIRGDAQNIGFAIPVGKLNDSLPKLLDVERRYRVVSGLTLNGGLKPVVASVQSGSPAARSGIRVGDEVTAVDGQLVSKTVDFHIALIGKRAGDPVRLALRRNNRPFGVNLYLAERPKPDGIRLAKERFGLELQGLSPDVARKLGLPAARGLIITRIEPNSPADRVGLEPADILIEVGTHQLETIEDLGMILERVASGDQVRIAILRVGNRAIYRLAAQMAAR